MAEDKREDFIKIDPELEKQEEENKEGIKKKRKNKTKVSPLDLQEKKKLMDNVIFDKDLVQQTKNFTQFKLDHETFAYGLLLPRWINLLDKNKEVLGKEQILSPFIITSKREFIEATKEIELAKNIKFRAIPTNLNQRWSGESIQAYLEGDESIPDITPKELYDKIYKKYDENVFERDSTWNKVDTLWDMGTYFFELCDIYPIRNRTGMKETGKTKKMKISKNLTFNASEIMIDPSEATLFRETNDKKWTKYIDEAEKLFRDIKGYKEPDKRIELINGSYSRGSAFVPRMETIKNKFIAVYYDCYCPTQISSIRGLRGATESRAITSVSTKNLDSDPRGEKEPNDNDPEWEILRDYLYIFGLTHFKEFEEIYRDDSFYASLNIKKRDLQIWKPLLALAELIDHNLFLEIVGFADKLSIQKREDFIPEDHFDFRLLKIVREMIEVSEIVRPKKIAERYKELFEGEKIRELSFVKRLDNLGFKELREKDRLGSKFIIKKGDFLIRIQPISPELTQDLEKIEVLDQKEG